MWYFDADERARAKEKYLSGEIHALLHRKAKYDTALTVNYDMYFLNGVLSLGWTLHFSHITVAYLDRE